MQIFFSFWGFAVVFILILMMMGFINGKTKLSKNDVYGTYVIDKTMFAGKNAEWQYNHFSFTINKDDVFTFYEYGDNGKIKGIQKGEIEFVNGYESPHIRIVNLNPDHQVIEKEPLLVRGNWNFYYVFKSKNFGNMFFIKEKRGFFDQFRN